MSRAERLALVAVSVGVTHIRDERHVEMLMRALTRPRRLRLPGVKAALVGLLLWGGCAMEATPGTRPLSLNRSEQALADWQAHGNYVGECEQDLDLIVLLEAVNSREAQTYCRAPEAVLGCMDDNTLVYDGSQSPGQLELTIEHEMRHWLAGCAYGIVDGNHEHPAFWYDYHGRSVR